MQNKISQITSSVSNDFDIFQSELRKIINTYDDFLKNDLFDFVFNDAKFLRPRLVFLFSKILNIRNENVIKIALATELIHDASLIHDDIIDESILRRNIQTFHKKFNTKIAVLTGDLLLSSALNVLSNTTDEIIKIFSNKIFKTIQGEIKQNKNNKIIISYKTYLNKTFNKTANLFFAGLESLFALKETNKTTRFYLKKYLKNFSLAFQIQNDIKDIDSDYKNGNYTLPLIFYFRENKNYNKNNLEKYIIKSKKIVEKYKEKAIFALSKIENIENQQLRELIEII